MIRVSDIEMVGNELSYVTEAVKRRELSWHGPFVRQFEEAFAKYVGAPHALTCSTGTAALHLALLALGIGPGDEVVMPVLTYVATANAVRYCGATPVFVDVQRSNWCIDPDAVDRAITSRTRAILPVQLYGHWPDMDHLLHIARRRQVHVVEDSAEALNAYWRGRHAGTFGDIGAFSFYANKTITTGEGGMVVLSDGNLVKRIRLFREQGADTHIHQYFHSVVGCNYRMTNLQAAVGLAQLETINYHSAKRQAAIDHYRRRFASYEFQNSRSLSQPSDWMFAMLLPPGVHVPTIRQRMTAAGIETRPIFIPMHLLPMYRQDRTYDVAQDIASRGINLPTHAGLTPETLTQVCEVLEQSMRQEATA